MSASNLRVFMITRRTYPGVFTAVFAVASIVVCVLLVVGWLHSYRAWHEWGWGNHLHNDGVICVVDSCDGFLELRSFFRDEVGSTADALPIHPLVIGHHNVETYGVQFLGFGWATGYRPERPWPNFEMYMFTAPAMSFYAVQLPYWFVVLLTLIAPFRWCLLRRAMKSRSRRGLCEYCCYDLRSSKDRCPECGLPIASTRGAGSPSQLP